MSFDYLFWTTAGLAAFTALFNVLGANLYDLRQIKQRVAKLRRRPLVTVVVHAQNQAPFITGCLDSLYAARYRNLEVVMADNASADGTAKQVRSYAKAHPSRRIKLYAKRRPGSPPDVLLEAFKRHGRGELVLCLDQPLIMEPKALHLALQYFKAGHDVLLPNYKVLASYKMSGLFEEFWLLLQGRSHKAQSLLRSTYPAQLPFFCRQESIQAALKGRPSLKIGYASNIVLYGRAGTFYGLAKRSYSRQLARLRSVFNTPPAERHIRQALPMLVSLAGLMVGLALPVLLTYFAYLALHLHEPDLLVVSWVGLALYLLFAVWEDAQLRLSQKLKYALLMPITYVWFYLMSLTHYLVVLTSYKAFGLRLRLRRA